MCQIDICRLGSVLLTLDNPLESSEDSKLDGSR